MDWAVTDQQGGMAQWNRLVWQQFLAGRQAGPLLFNQPADGTLVRNGGFFADGEEPLEGLARQATQPESLDPSQHRVSLMEHQIALDKRGFLAWPQLDLAPEPIRQWQSMDFHGGQPNRQQQLAGAGGGIQQGGNGLKTTVDQTPITASLWPLHIRPGPVLVVDQALKSPEGWPVAEPEMVQGPVKGFKVEGAELFWSRFRIERLPLLDQAGIRQTGLAMACPGTMAGAAFAAVKAKQLPAAVMIGLELQHQG